MRTFDAGVRKQVLAAIERIVNAEAEASGAPRKPEIMPLDRYPLNVNDETLSNRIAEAFRDHFSPERVKHTGPAPASESFGCFGTAVPMARTPSPASLPPSSGHRPAQLEPPSPS